MGAVSFGADYVFGGYLTLVTRVAAFFFFFFGTYTHKYDVVCAYLFDPLRWADESSQ